MNKNLSIVSQAFAKDMAHRYAIPELLTKKFVSDDSKAAVAKIVSIQPGGLLGEVIKDLSALITVRADTDSKHLYHGNIQFRYEYNAGTFGAVTTDFYISVQAYIGDNSVEESYIDAIEKNAFQIVRMHIYYEPAKKTK